MTSRLSGVAVGNEEEAPSTSSVCARCRRTGVPPSDVHAQREGARSAPKPVTWTCPWCVVVVANRFRLKVMGAAAVLAVVGALVWGSNADLGWYLVSTGATLALLMAPVPLIVVHELAHAGAARLMGGVVSAVTIGSGRVVASRTSGLCRFELRRLPWGGSTAVHLGGTRQLRARRLAVYAVGPVADALFFLVVWRWAPGDAAAHTFDQTMTWAAAIQFFHDAIPWRRLAPSGNDGSMSLDTIRMSDLQLAEEAQDVRRQILTVMILRDRAEEAIAELERDLVATPDHPGSLLTLLFAALLDDRFDEAVALGRRLQALPGVPEPMLPIISANLAAALTLTGSPNVLAEADRLSGEAATALGWHGPIIAIRALVLTALRLDLSARAEALEAVTRCEERRDRAHAFAIMAALDERVGDLRSARVRLRVAHSLWPTEVLLHPEVRRRTLRTDRPPARASPELPASGLEGPAVR